MKFALVVLIFYFFINLISAFSWFSSLLHQEPKQTIGSSSSHRSTFHSQTPAFQQQNQFRNVNNPFRQAIMASNKNIASYLPRQRIVNQQKYPFHNTTVIQRQAGSINNKSSQIIPQNRFQAIAYQQQQYRSLNNLSTFRQVNRVNNTTNNQRINRKFRPFLSTGKNNPPVVNPNTRVFPSTSLTKSVLADSKPKNSSSIKNNLQSFRARTTEATNSYSENRQRLLADFYYQQRLREFYQRINEQNASRARSNIKSALRKRKRQNQENDIQSEVNYPMIFSRDLVPNQDDPN